MKSKKKRPN